MGTRSPSLMVVNFYPRPPRGGRLGLFFLLHQCAYFYPRPPRGGRPCCFFCFTHKFFISIHALREEGDFAGDESTAFVIISIHALREEGDGFLLS